MNSGFYDIHCHILPGADDGAKIFTEALDMLNIAYNDGIRHIVLTPHYQKGHFELPLEQLKVRYEILKKEAKKQFPDMELYLGTEICHFHDVPLELTQGKVASIAGTRYVLVEFYPKSELRSIFAGLQEIQMAGYNPILAHVERYEALNGNLDEILHLIRMGIYIQVNASSVIGKSGRKTKNFVKKLLERDMVHFIGTDAHGIEHRRPVLSECASYITRKWGQEYTELLLKEYPQRMLNDEYI